MLHRDVAPGIHRLEHAFTNAYLIEEAGRLTLVDTLFPASWGEFTDALAELGKGLGDVDAVLLTHAHFDHMGFARKAREEAGLPLWGHPEERAVVAEPWDYDHERNRLGYGRHPKFLAIFTAMGAQGALMVKGTELDHTFGDGDVLEVPGRPRVVFCPGHTYGHCAFHLPERDALIAGDAIVNLNPYTGDTGPQIVAGAATADSEMNLRSLDALEATGAQTVLTGHGDPITGGIAAAAAEARRRGPS